MEILTLLVSLILFIVPIFDWTASVILHRASKLADHENIALHERAKIAIILAVVTSLNAILASFRLFDLHVPPEGAVLILSASLILVSVPNLYWLSLYYRNRLRK